MRKETRLICILLCVMMLTNTVFAATDRRISNAAKGLTAAGRDSDGLLNNAELFPVGTSGCDWSAVALALSGEKEHYAEYLDRLQTYVEKAYAKEGCLDRIKATEYHRIALTVMALGGDPTSFGCKPDGTVIDLIAEGTYNFAGEDLGLQGLNGWIWALITLNAGSFEVPAGARYRESDMIEAILSAQEPDGGFGLIPGSSDVDITAMAVQALAPFRGNCKDEIHAALNYLASQMTDACGFVSYGEENAESCSQVILALCALGIDPEKDDRFVKEDQTLLSQLQGFVQPNGTFAHTKAEQGTDYLATSQAMFALIAASRLRAGEPWVFCFDGYKGPNQITESKIVYIVIGIAAAAVCGIVITGKRKKHG